MNIPMTVFAAFLKNYRVLCNERAGQTQVSLPYIYRYYDGVTVNECEALYGYAKELPTGISGKNLILSGIPSKEILAENAVLYVTEGGEAFFHEVLKLAGRFTALEGSVQTLLKSSDPYKLLVNEISEIFGNHVFIHDFEYKLLCASADPPGDNQWEYNQWQKCYVLSEDIIGEFKCNPDYLKSMETCEAAVFPADTFGYRILYKNLWDKQEYQGRICVCELKRALHEGDFWLIEWMSDLVNMIMKFGGSIKKQRMTPVVPLLEYMLNQGDVQRSQLDQLLLQTGWTSKDRYYLVVLFPEQSDKLIRTENYQRQKLAEMSPDFSVLNHDGRFLLLVNESVNELSLADFRYNYSYLLRDLLLKVGVSGYVSDLMEIRQMYLQAITAYRYGVLKDSMFWMYFFDDYRLDYMISKAMGEFSCELICRQELFILRDYDKDHTSELFRSLYVFLKWERSIARACEELGIHRTTLLYRLQRINQLTHLNLDDPDVRLELILFYRFLLGERDL